MLRALIQTLALLMTFESALFLVKSTLSTSIAALAKISQTNWDYNLALAKTLAGQQADTRVGISLLFLGLLLQMGNLLWEMRWDDFSVNKTGVVLAVAVAILIGLIALQFSRHLQKLTYSKIEKRLKEIEAKGK